MPDGVGYTRPKEGFRFKFDGLKTNSVPDALPHGKYPYAQNIRALQDHSIRTRWGFTKLFGTSSGPISNIRSYAALNTDNIPRFLALRPTGFTLQVWLGKAGGLSSNVGSLAAVNAVVGGSMVPFRPAESPIPWMYIANGTDYQKFSAPDAGDAVIQQKVGIAEPQTACDAAIASTSINFQFGSNPTYVQSGVATAPSGAGRITDTVQSVFADSVNAGLSTIGVSAGQPYARFMSVAFAGTATQVEDVFPSQPVPIGIASIYYFSGSTGRCVIVPKQMSPGPGTEGQSLYTQNLLGSLRRGSLVKFAGGVVETVLVLSATEGPDGTICFETSTVSTHTAAETFTQPPAVLALTAPTVGQAITSPIVNFNLSGAGIGTQTSSAALGSPFVSQLQSFQPEDYIHFSVNISTLASLNEIKVLFDVGDGTFTQNFYFYTLRVSDIEAAIQNTLTQLGAAQLVTQRAVIDQEKAAASRNQLSTSSSSQTTPGDFQWAEVVFPISALTRVGSDVTKTLQNVGKIQFLFNVNATTNAALGIMTIWGGQQPDVGDSGAPYLYRVRPRSSVTGVKGNPSPTMRYGVTARREAVTIALPSALYDPQIDTLDVFRYGGSVTSWRKIGQTASTNTTFLDNYSDEVALASEELELDNLEPWPTVDVPLNATTVSVNGTTAVINIPGTTNVLRFLPGNLVRIGGINVYTLRVRPTLISGTNYLFQFVENAGSLGSGIAVSIYEPQVARQFLPYMWGPDASGTVFAVGDPLRLGTLYFAKNYAPDSAPDSYNQEIVTPSEPLLGGEIIDGLSYVASTERWWALYPQPNNPAQRYSAVQQPLTKGLAAPFGHCTDGKTLYWWSKDGIESSDKGSLTDADLYNIFPHDGVVGVNVTYNGNTVYAPGYSYAAQFRLSLINRYLYAVYLDASGGYHTLVMDVATGAWSIDVMGGVQSATVYYQPEQQSGNLLTVGTPYTLAVVGTTFGNVETESDLTNDDGAAISCILATNEWDGGDIRAGEQWGDLWAYLTPAARGGLGGVVAVPMAFGAPVAGVASTTIPASASTVQTPITLGGEVLSDFLGLQFTWTDDFTQQSVATVLRAWQPSFISKPETIADRFTDWYDGGTEQAKYVQGFLLHADTSNVVKGLQVRDSDTLTLHPFTPTVQHNGESILAYSFNTPFIAHLVRIEPTDQVAWRFFDVDWVFEPTSEAAETWATQGTAHGLQGYMHVKQVSPCYAATTPVTLTITSFDGQSPAPITLPATGGLMQKVAFMLTPNKGQLYFYTATSSAPFQLFLENWEIEVGGWQRQDNYLRYRNLGASTGDKALV